MLDADSICPYTTLITLNVCYTTWSLSLCPPPVETGSIQRLYSPGHCLLLFLPKKQVARNGPQTKMSQTANRKAGPSCEIPVQHTLPSPVPPRLLGYLSPNWKLSGYCPHWDVEVKKVGGREQGLEVLSHNLRHSCAIYNPGPLNNHPGRGSSMQLLPGPIESWE